MFTSCALLQLPGLLSLSTKFLPTVMNLLKKLAEQGQVPTNNNNERNPSLAAASIHSDITDMSSSQSSEVISSDNGTEYSSPAVHNRTQ